MERENKTPHRFAPAISSPLLPTPLIAHLSGEPMAMPREPISNPETAIRNPRNSLKIKVGDAF
jgi:hypothetical protein